MYIIGVINNRGIKLYEAWRIHLCFIKFNFMINAGIGKHCW